MLTVSFVVEYHLFNGSVGKIIDIIYPEGKTQNNCSPSVVMVYFPKYTGPSYVEKLPNIGTHCDRGESSRL